MSRNIKTMCREGIVASELSGCGQQQDVCSQSLGLLVTFREVCLLSGGGVLP